MSVQNKVEVGSLPYNTQYNLLDFNQLFIWIQYRWSIMKSLLSSSTLPTTIPKFTDPSVSLYEDEYLRFLTDYTNGSKPFSDIGYNDNKIARYLQSIMNDIEACLYFPDGYMRFYAYEKLNYKIELTEIQRFRESWTNKVNKLKPLSSGFDIITNPFEDTLATYRQNVWRPASPIIYSKEIDLGNQNVRPIYLLEVHIRNCIITNSKSDFVSKFINFLVLHNPTDYNNPMLIQLMKKFIVIMTTFQSKFGANDIFELYQYSTTKLGGHSIFAIANLVIGAGDRPISEFLLPVDMMSIVSDLIIPMNAFVDLRTFMRHIPDIMDIQNLQLSLKHFNQFLPKAIIDYGLLTPTLTEPDLIINSIVTKSFIPDREKIIDTLMRQQYHVAQVQSPECLLYRSYLIKILIALCKKVTN